MKNLGTTEIIFVLLVVFALFGFGWIRRLRDFRRRTREAVRQIFRPGAEDRRRN